MGTESGGQRQALSTPAVQRLLAGLWPMKKSGAGLAGSEAGQALHRKTGQAAGIWDAVTRPIARMNNNRSKSDG